MYISRLLYDIRQDYSYVKKNTHKQAAKRSIYNIRKYFSRSTISEIFEFRTQYRLSNDGFFQQIHSAG